MSSMEDILANQEQLLEGMEQVLRNFKKEPLERKTSQSIKKRLQTLDSYWEEFQANHIKLCEYDDRGYTYFSENFYHKTMTFYAKAKEIIQKYKVPSGDVAERSPRNPTISVTGSQDQNLSIKNQHSSNTPEVQDESNPEGHNSSFSKSRSQGNASKLEEMLRKQRSNFKALSRSVMNVDLENISEKWEYEDVLRIIQSRWLTIDSLHWEIDSELYEENEEYEQAYSKYEQLYTNMKKSINSKMYSASHRDNCTPKLELSPFFGNYHKWVSFKDLYTETIHNNRSMSSAQKMQFLKSKVKGEAERLIQHLNISSENYQVCWEILNHRYNNTKLIFTSHINILLSLHTMQQQTDTHIKNIFDTTNECLNAIKNLGVDISTWDPLIVHLLSQKLDAQTHSEYIESLKQPRELPKLQDFLIFLENKYTALESSRRKQNMPRSSTSITEKDTQNHQNIKKQIQNKSNNHYNKCDSNRPFIRNSNMKSFVTRTLNCPLCKDRHGLFHCKTFLDSNSETKRLTVQRLNLCKNCLYDHKDKPCCSEAKCRVCQGRHNTLLHDAFQSELAVHHTDTSMTPSPSTSRVSKSQNNVTHVSKENIAEILLATALVKITGANGSNYILRALIDQGSQVSLMSENAAQMLCLPRRACKGVIFGVGSNQNNCKGIMDITASSLYSDFKFRTEVFIMKNLINNLPNQTFVKPSWAYLQNIQLADPDFNMSRPVDLLLGAEVYSDIIMAGIIKENGSHPVAQQSHLGWILSGQVKSYQCNVVLNNIQDIQRFWTIEDIAESDIGMSSQDYQCIQQYKSDTKRRDDGKYVVRLPLKPDIHEKLGESKKKAVAQFLQLEKKFSRNEHIAQQYKSFIKEYIALGHMTECTRRISPDCILPHLSVLRPDSVTTTLRVVFNASAKTSSGYSLNDMMYSGPNLQQDLFTLILKWRQYEYALTADIEKMFRQIFCNEKDQQYQKIVWRNSPDDILREYKLTTVTYGTKAAPFLAMMTLKQLAEDERSKYPTASRVLEEDFYMDDLLSGQHSLKDAIQLKSDLTKLLKSGGFNLRKWSTNKPEILEGHLSHNQQTYEFRHQESTKTLGLRWLPKQDEFKFQLKIDTTSSTPATKRSLLSDISKIFDPLGWLSPITIKLKVLFQNVWTMDLQWDDPIPDSLNAEWLRIKTDLPEIEDIAMQRWLRTQKNANIELHGFCDSSIKAYACVIYCRIKNHNGEHSPVILIAGKSKLVPVKKTVSLPRLELSAAHLLSKLMKVVQTCLSSNKITIYGWSDSTAVLGWLQGDPNRWKPFVANRVRQVTETIPVTSWHYVKSVENPADCASRGLTVQQLKQHPLWWHGPTWLSTFNENHVNEQQSTYITLEEAKKSVQTNVTTNQQHDDIVQNLLNKHSSFNRVTRILAWTLRAISRTKHKQNFLTIAEMNNARNILIKRIQHSEFKDDIIHLQKHCQVDFKSKLLKLNPYLDQEGLLRVGGRLANAKINNNMKHPLVIPHSSHLTDLLIDQGHQMTHHGGTRLTLSWLRRKYWIIGGTRAVKKRLRNCIKCRRHDPVKHVQIMADIPAARCNPARPFQHAGTDMTGFVDVKMNKGRGAKTTKGYIAVFVCMVTKAVHLELVSDLSSSSFLAALRRMAARRGAPQHVYSDNGTNFVGASRLLNEEYIYLQDILDREFFDAITDMEITWHFNAPSWPSAGGLWEAAVKSLKHHLKRVIGEQKLTFEEYSTLLAQLEACLNSRPLCALSEDPEDLNCLTPSHFLASGPTLTIVETERDLRTRWQLTQKIFDDVWKRWRAEYLCQLSARSKWRQPQANLKVNDVVIIHDINLPAGKWPLGRVSEVHPGKDGYVRVVTVQTQNGKMKRPITKLSVLPVHQDRAENQNINNDKS